MNSFLTPGRAGAWYRRFAFVFALALVGGGAWDVFQLSGAAAVDEEPDYPGIFDDIAGYLRGHYLDQERVGPRARTLTAKALSALENMADEISVDNSASDSPVQVVHVGDKQKAISLSRIASLESGISTLKDLSEFLKENYRGKQSVNALRKHLANGFLSGIDPHTQVFDPKAFKEFAVHIEGEIFGVGMYVASNKGVLVVRKVLPGTPAEAAGFKRGDRILKIGDESTVNLDVTEAVTKIRGEENSEIVLTIKRKESKESQEWVTKAIKVARRRVTIPSVVARLLKSPPLSDGKVQDAPPGEEKRELSVGYVQVSNFDKNTVPSLRESLRNLRTDNGGNELDGLILDLRENSGGLLKQAEEMADLFLTEGELYWIAARGHEEKKSARNDRREPSYPIVALANDLSASGAEIVVGALQKNRRAVVLGTPTFGKGSVQQLHPLDRNGDWQLKITVSEYLIPGKISIQENGVVPDILAERVILSDKITNLFPNRRLGTERDYDEHIVSKYSRKEEPRETLKYLFEIPETEEIDDPDAADLPGAGDVEPEKDALVLIAKDLVRAAVKSQPPGAMFESRAFLASHGAEIEAVRGDRLEAIVKRLKERKIDWEAGNNPESPKLDVEVEHRFTTKPSTDKDDPAPRPFLLLKARVTNRSESPLFRVKAITASDYYVYREQELLFGKLEPGVTVERSAEIGIPYFPYARSDVLRLQFSGDELSATPGKSGPEPRVFLEREHAIELAAAARPTFAYSAVLMDKQSQTALTHLKDGAEAVLQVTVRNVGQATVQKGITILKNKSDKAVFLHPPGRLDIDRPLAPGDSIDAEFAFHVLDTPANQKFAFEIAMGDSYSGEGLTRELVIGTDGSDIAAFPNGTTFQSPQIQARVVEPPPATAGVGAAVAPDPAAKRQPSVLVTDLAEVILDATISGAQTPFEAWVTSTHLALHERDPDKLSLASSTGKDDLRLHTRIPLKKGVNVVHVVASDQNGLQTRHVLYVRRR